MDIERLLQRVDRLLHHKKGDIEKDELFTLLKELRLACEHFKAQANIDFLTGLFNRRYFEEQLDLAVERARRDKVPFSLIIIDLDHFKQVNDQFGHLTGDQVLQQVARLIRKNVRKVDIPARYGGEEFAVLLPGTGQEGALAVAWRIKRGIEKFNFGDNMRPLKITASLGVGTYRPFSRLSATDFLEKVDRLLYLAKEKGRNCIVHQDLPLHHPSEGLSSDEKKALLNGVWSHDD